MFSKEISNFVKCFLKNTNVSGLSPFFSMRKKPLYSTTQQPRLSKSNWLLFVSKWLPRKRLCIETTGKSPGDSRTVQILRGRATVAPMAQWWERAPPTNVVQVQIPELGWICCWFSPLLQEVFLQVLRFSPLLKNEHFQILIGQGMADEEPLCGCATSKY